MNSYIIATVSMIAAAVLIAATIAVPISSNSAYAATSIHGQNAQNGLSQSANQAGLVNVGNVGIPVAANVDASCAVNVLSATSC
jgi:hypothetical protein